MNTQPSVNKSAQGRPTPAPRSRASISQPLSTNGIEATAEKAESAAPSFDVYVGEKRDFDAIRKDCLSRGAESYYEDPEFPAVVTSLYFSKAPPRNIEWLRPKVIAAKYGMQAELFSSESSMFTVLQGELGDSRLISAVAIMSENRELLAKVVPGGQSFMSGWYAGAFLFQFYRHGSWEEVIVDDRLPTSEGRLLFVHSSRPNEFWPALLEKAYAKLMGSYEALRSGRICDVLHDLTGGLVESFNFERDPPPPAPLITAVFFKALQRYSLIGCCVNIEPVEGCPAAVLSNGLITGHQYNVTDIREIKLTASDSRVVPLTLVRVRNPWGKQRDWRGAWSERSREWSSIEVSDRQAMGLLRRDEGEFWMDITDFLDNFDLIEICTIPPPPTDPSTLDTASNHGNGLYVNAAVWRASRAGEGGRSRGGACYVFDGKWKRGVTAGGRPACKDTHWVNPQYKLTLNYPDEDNDKLCTVLIELEQKDGRLIRHKARANVDIGFVIYKCDKAFPLPLPNEYFVTHTFTARCDHYSNTRSVTKRLTLEPGAYIIIPSSYEPDVEAAYLLRVLTESNNSVEYVDVSTDVAVDSSGGVGGSKDVGVGGGELGEGREREEQFQRYFYNVAGEDMQIDVYQFHQLLATTFKPENKSAALSLSVCKSLLSLVDHDCSGKLDYLEFIYLWNMLKCWKKTFKSFDKSNRGAVDAYELRLLIATLGYRLGSGFTDRLVFRYANGQYLIDLENFIACMVRVQSLYEVFKQHEKNGKMTCSLNEWLEISLSM